MIDSPALTFGLIIGAFYGALAHIIVGGDGRRLVVLIIASWIGFGIGQAVGEVMSIDVPSIGSIRVMSATLGSFIATLTAAFLWITRKTPTP